ncbi:TIGR01777 family protein [Xylella fastidiosa]|uniref:TIGR01777 family protein n=2 Tax=Xylella fastidiosa TaxID=2371 RepID=A0ABC8ABJ2_XYLFS|nr:TIGR01777 family oxidoreductase [Xylella fastidiosa]AAF83099.1 cell division inhibitor [Xylella fastidiosa 9a5c]ALQ93994.1 NAD-dependent dehydratase [Xylella fastidiosa]ALQ96240.1 TIGR01777 family protein [Xylella fastidiosa]ALR01091.1 NAD-dependent dehydratase [Xylella fastidiosa]ALR03471.1 TIGR01777 family protein [Xylella fastidiosa]
MHLLITGGTGFIGTPLCAMLIGGGHQVTVLSRDPTRHSARLPQVQLVNTLENVVTPIDAIINLAGKSLLEGRWNKHIKEEIRASRLQTTRRLYDWIATLAVEQRPRRLISASAIGYYGESGDTPLKESAPPGNDFAAQLCRDWENEALRISALGSQVSLIRIGIVLERDGGALGQMLPAFRFGVGGRFGNGQHWMSWIHREDLINMIIWLIEHGQPGAYNLTAPHPVINAAFVRALGAILHRPTLFTLPPQLLRLCFGEIADLLTLSQRVKPGRALEEGYRFKYTDINAALASILRKN